MEIKELQKLITKFIDERNWKKYHKPKNLAMSISIEAAELMELFQWISVNTSMDRLNDDIFLDKVKDELADILIYSLSFANIAGLDVSKIIEDKIDRNEKRFPKDKTYYY